MHAPRRTAYLGQVQTRAVSSVVVIPVHVQNLLALDGEQSREDTLGQASAEHNDLGYYVSQLTDDLDTSPYIVFFIHGRSVRCVSVFRETMGGEGGRGGLDCGGASYTRPSSIDPATRACLTTPPIVCDTLESRVDRGE